MESSQKITVDVTDQWEAYSQWWQRYSVDIPSSFEPKIRDLTAEEATRHLNNRKRKYQDKSESTCSICLCNITLHEGIWRLDCGHFYHEECLQTWWEHDLEELRCPLCRQDNLPVVTLA